MVFLKPHGSNLSSLLSQVVLDFGISDYGEKFLAESSEISKTMLLKTAIPECGASSLSVCGMKRHDCIMSNTRQSHALMREICFTKAEIQTLNDSI